MPVTLSPLEAYRLWAPCWEADPSAIVALESRFLTPWLTELNGTLLVDLSCGTGRWLAFAQSGGATVFGLDLCREMLIEAQKKPGLAGKLAQADTRRLPLPDGCADVVLCALALGHMSPLESAIDELARILRPGAKLFITDFHPEALDRGWKRSFRSGGQSFEIETSPYTTQGLTECAAHAGLALEEMVEPGFGEPEREIFERAGKGQLFEQVRDVPAVLVARWTRP